MTPMTKRERVLRTAQFADTDRVPLYDLLQNDAVIERFSGRPLDYDTGFETVARAVGRLFDMTRSVGGPQRPATTRRDDGFLIRGERWTSWIVERPFHDLPTLVRWIENSIRTEQARTFGPEQAASLHRHIEKLWALFAETDPTGRGDPAVFVVESGVGLDGMVHLAGMDLFVELMTERPDLLEEWLDARNQAELRRVAAIARPEYVPIVLTYDDIAHKTGTIFAPDWLRAIWVPRLKRLVDAWHARDTYCLFHSDGNLWPVLDDIVGAGVDGLNPLEVLAGMTIASVRARYPRLFLAGGIDVSQLLALGTPDEVRTVCEQAIRDTGGRGLFMGSSTELHWELRLDNVIAMCETAWNSGPLVRAGCSVR